MINKQDFCKFKKRAKSMLAVDLRRMCTTPLFYIMLGVSLIIPILILVMTSFLGNSVDPQTGESVAIEGFKNVWQIIGSVNNSTSAMTMDITSMCNINLMYFLISIFVCIFVADDFRSGYSKNLFTTRAKKDDYIFSKSIVCFIAGSCMILVFFIGALIGGAVAGLSFALEGISVWNIVMSLISKIFLVAIFSSIYLLASVIAKQKLWLSLILSFGIGMLFFSMVPMITPLNTNIVNMILCVVGGLLFGIGIGVGSYFVLKKTNIC